MEINLHYRKFHLKMLDEDEGSESISLKSLEASDLEIIFKLFYLNNSNVDSSQMFRRVNILKILARDYRFKTWEDKVFLFFQNTDQDGLLRNLKEIAAKENLGFYRI
jgi:hypothetical protein